MLKVLVADENLKTNLDCCRFLANDKSLDVVSTSTGINTIDTYYKIKPNVLVINSNFQDKSYTDIINELSSTSEGRNNCNIILTVEKNTNLNFNSMAKVYHLFYLPTKNRNNELKETITQFSLDHYIFYEPNDDNLSAILYKLKIYNELEGAEYLKYAIKQCYNNPKLKKDLSNIFKLVSEEYKISYESVRPAMRYALKSLNKYRESHKDVGYFKLFENEDSITPKNFIRIITDHYLEENKKK